MRRPGGPPVPPRSYGFTVIVILALLLAGVGVWYLVAPYSFFQVVYRIRPVEPVVESLTVGINGEARTFTPDRTFEFHPGDYLTVETFASNLEYNVGLNLEAPGVEAEALDGQKSLLELRGEKAFVQPFKFSILVKKEDKTVAVFHLRAAMTALDWATRAKRAADDGQKIYYLRLAEKLAPDNPFILENLAMLLEKKGEYTEAGRLYEKCLGRKDSRITLEKILSVYLKTDQREKITELYRRLIDKSRADAAVKYLADLAKLQEKWGRFQPAAQTYEELAAKVPDREKKGPLKRLLAVYKKLENRARTIETYQRLIKIASGREAVDYRMELGRLYEVAGQWDRALAIFRRLASELPPMEAAAVWKKIGLVEAKNNHIEEAVKAYEAAGELDKKDKNIQVNLARLYLLKGDRDNYRKGLANLLKIDPDDADVTYELAQALLQDGRDDEAARYFSRLLEKEPDRIEARLALLGILEKKGDRARMAPHYEYLLEHDPENKILSYNLGVIYLETGDLARAEEKMKSFVEASPDDVDARKYLYEIYSKEKKKDEAVKVAMDLTRLAPDEEVWYDLVFQYMKEKKDWTGLAGEAEKWVDKRPKSIALKKRLATARIAAKQLGRAAETLEQILELDPKNVEVMVELADIYEKEGKSQDALRVMAQVLKIDPDNKEAADAHIRLRLKTIKAKHAQ